MLSISTDIKHKAHRVCGDYLVGVWQSIKQDEIILKYKSGGEAHITLLLKLPSQFKSENGEPTEVIMRNESNIVGGGCFRQMIQNSIAIKLAEVKLVPKVYGIFDGGRLEKYIKAKPLVNADLDISVILNAIVKKLAHLHSMKLPINMNEKEEYRHIKKFWRNIIEWGRPIEDPRNEQGDQKQKPVIDDKELEWLKQEIDSLDSKKVFCHGNLHVNNILLPIDSLHNVYFVYLDHCEYNYRGYDFANFFVNGFCLIMPEQENTKCDWNHYPSLEKQTAIFRVYLEEFKKITGKNFDIETEEKSLMKETKIFSLLFFWQALFCGLEEKDGIPTYPTNKIDWLELPNINLLYKKIKKNY